MLRFTRLLTNSIELENYIIKRYAGHSKWANIKHIKALKDGQRSAQFTKLGRQMKVAVQEGGSTNPLSNLLLSQVIEQAKRANMPIASIQSVLKSCESNKNNSKKYRIEIRAAGRAIILCELFTDNIAKIKQNVSTLLRKASFAYADSGAKHVFEHKGLVDTDIPEDLRSKTEEDILELVTDHAIEVGCDDVSFLNIEDSKMLRFTCDPRQFVRIENQLQTKYNYNILSSCEEFIPVNVVSLSEKDFTACEKFIQKLEEFPEVISVYSNINIA